MAGGKVVGGKVVGGKVVGDQFQQWRGGGGEVPTGEDRGTAY